MIDQVMDNTMSTQKRTWYMLFFAFIGMALMNGLLVAFLARSGGPHPNPAAARPFVYALASVALVMAASTSLLKMPRDCTPSRFMTALILALGFAETNCILGLLLFFLGAPAGEFVRFLAATLVVDLLLILPRIARRPE